MRQLKKQVYLTPDQLDQQIREREATAASLQECEAKESMFREIERLRVYANMKRLLAAQKQRDERRFS